MRLEPAVEDLLRQRLGEEQFRFTAVGEPG
jgi:hypothetical protein